MSEQNQTVDQEVTSEEFVTEVAQPEKTSREEKFFGHTTTIGKTPEDRVSESLIKSAENSNEVEVEIIDDRPIADRKNARVKVDNDDEDVESEIAGLDEKVKKRINKLKYEFHEERRAKEASDKVRDEAVVYAQGIQDENKRLSSLVNKGEEALLGQISAKAQAEMEKAKSEFKDAYESGNSDKMLEANEKILNSQVDFRSANDRISYYEQQKELQAQQPVAQQQQQQNVSQQFAPPDPKSVKWLQDNKWFGHTDHKDMTGFAYGLHETLIQDENILPTSEEYYEQINKRVRNAFPKFFGTENPAEDNIEKDVVATASSRKPSSVVAPATRNNGATPRKVQLTATQVNLARRLGITPEQYAKQLQKESNNV